MYLTYNASSPRNGKVFDPTSYSSDLPDTVDWRTMNAVTPVKRQVHTSYTGYGDYTELTHYYREIVVPAMHSLPLEP